jgi:hypothetical protein
MTIKNQLRNRMKKGYGINKDDAFRITGTSSSQRRLQELAKQDNLFYFDAEHRTKGKPAYRVFFSNNTKLTVVFLKDLKSGAGYRILIPGFRGVHRSKPFKTKGIAVEAIKES